MCYGLPVAETEEPWAFSLCKYDVFLCTLVLSHIPLTLPPVRKGPVADVLETQELGTFSVMCQATKCLLGCRWLSQWGFHNIGSHAVPNPVADPLCSGKDLGDHVWPFLFVNSIVVRCIPTRPKAVDGIWAQVSECRQENHEAAQIVNADSQLFFFWVSFSFLSLFLLDFGGKWQQHG